MFSVKKHLSAHMLTPKPQKCMSQPWPQGAHRSAIRTDQETSDCLPLSSDRATYTAGTAHAETGTSNRRGPGLCAEAGVCLTIAFRANEEWEGLSEWKAQQQETTWPAPGTAHSWANTCGGWGGRWHHRRAAVDRQTPGPRDGSRPPPPCCTWAKRSGNDCWTLTARARELTPL